MELTSTLRSWERPRQKLGDLTSPKKKTDTHRTPLTRPPCTQSWEWLADVHFVRPQRRWQGTSGKAEGEAWAAEAVCCTHSAYHVSPPPLDLGSEAAPCPAHPRPPHFVTSTAAPVPKDHVRLLPVPIPCVLKNNQTEPKRCGLSVPGVLGVVLVEGGVECGLEGMWGGRGARCRPRCFA